MVVQNLVKIECPHHKVAVVGGKVDALSIIDNIIIAHTNTYVSALPCGGFTRSHIWFGSVFALLRELRT